MKSKLTLLVASLLFIIAPIFVQNASAQLEFPEDKVSWNFSIEQHGDEATLVGKITMLEHWHIYAVHLPDGVFTLPTELVLDPSSAYRKNGKVTEPKPHFEHDEMADEDLYYHSNTIFLKQKIKITSTKDFKLTGKFGFQTCDSTHCLPPFETGFSVNVKGVNPEAKPAPIDELNVPIESSAVTPQVEISVPSSEVETNKETSSSKDLEEDTPVNNDTDNMSVWAIFALSFASGLAALLTPCVFPMIPMTVSFFTKQSKTRAKGIQNAVIYAISIIAIYILLGTVVTAIFGAEVLNEMSTNPWFNIVFFVLLVVFAISFMGAFEIRMPNSWVNKADSKADKGGLIGIFFMALVLALVSFSCTGPIVGTLLVKAAESGGMTPIIGMFGFSLALALPFALFAAFPGWMNSLPQSGGWLNTVKVVLGFLELALAFKFLSNADLAWQSHLLEREVFLAIWIAVFTVLALYLFGKVILPHDSPIERLSVGRALFGTFVLAFVVYMIPGLWGAPLKLINAFPPPSTYAESPRGFGGGGTATEAHGPEGTHLATARGLYVFHDYDKAQAYAKKVNKPLFVDFTGWNCVNCRKMEEGVWVEDGVFESLRDDVVVVSLYVDERTDLPKSEQKKGVKVGDRTRDMITVGDKWMIKQITEYNIAAQPYYVMQTPEGEDLSNGSADFQNHSDPVMFKKWMEKGLNEFSKK
ncbi:MAG: cytochrome c biogenesis protein CcdA [Crocinitomicaceae bacterium]|nr:cytochrome c biogenesis protein CcdA [Crocinitomicaceae bacterium]MDG1776089.1 cytochrome c biogenesis protein CcdA [Crocinitomicaceae bacterium]